MGIAEFYYLEGGLFFGFLVAAGLTVISLSRPDYRVACRCAWAAAILFGSIAIVWGVTTTESAWIRVPAVGIVGLLAAISLTEALRFIKIREFPTVAEAPAVRRGPTLEATNRSTIDASGATIPGDLPFQFGRADNDSLIAMPGVKVTKTDNGWQVSPPENVNYNFPAPPAKYAVMPIPELRRQLQSTANELRVFQNQYTVNFRQSVPDTTKMREVIDAYKTDYDKRFSELSFSLASAAMSRIGMITLPKAASSGGQIVYYKKFVGPTPAGDAATFLEALSERLPKK